MNHENAAESLLGHTLTTGWKVIERIPKESNQTGSYFSICYKVQRNDEICFLKALNFVAFFKLHEGEKEITDVLTEMLEVHKYEKALSDKCRANHATKIAFVKESGEIIITGYVIPVVPYFIFDLADGDIRCQINFSNLLDFTWRLRSLHSVAVGIQQLHKINISHQDLKPSNILLFQKNTKIGDLGRSLCFDITSPYNSTPFTGDINYAPPEIIYKYYDIKEWHFRTYAIDCYLLGSLFVFYFSGISMTALLLKNLPENFHPGLWKGFLNELKPYLLDAFAKSLKQFSDAIEIEEFKNDFKELVEMLCNPFPENRGHKRNLFTSNPFNLERIISKFDYLSMKSEILLFSKKYKNG